MVVPGSGPLRNQAEYEDDIGVALDALEMGFVDVRLLCGADWQLQRLALAVLGGGYLVAKLPKIPGRQSSYLR